MARHPAPQPAPQPDPAAPEPVSDPPSRAIEVPLPRQLRVYARSPVRWRPGCSITVLRDGGETYPAMLAALAGARRTICLETYILAADLTGDRFKAVLMERARAGVAVRLIYDAVGSFGLPGGWVDDLRAAGCQVIAFNPIAQWRRRFRLSHRDHRKILVVDDEVAFTGGLNISNDYAAIEDGGVGWHDMHCKVTGRIVIDLARMFRRSWLRGGGTPYAPPRSPPPREGEGEAVAAPGASYARLIDNTRRRQRATTRRAYLHVLRAAREAVLIQNAYFLPDRGLRRAMARAARRGVDVRLIVPGRSDVKIIQWASLYVLRGLARGGVKVFQWRGPMMHAKTCVVDATWSTIGSYNFDSMSRFNNLEVTVEILDPAIATSLVGHFQRDLEGCDPYDQEAWRRLPWWKKALSWLTFRLRRFL
ncbi:MAG TPA: phosphatidylserine/phosphatidylglycerophosphate/cardiolipin synthase family protein [Kofleriaceae bacterium]|nr:phosphatidylserine/phosphatidylglycerophosphate/cardiolipin synthase family protein [Kofleriaceae bacterium]